jgi:hypothetical protein
MSINITSRKLNIVSNINSNNENNYNTLLLAIFLCATLLVILLMFFSQKYRVYRTLKNMDIYIKFQNIQSMKPNLIKDYKLCDFYVSSSYNSALSGTQLIDYVSTDMVKKVLQTGVRYLEFQVFGDKYGMNAEPIVSSGFRKGEWKMTLNTLYLEDVFKTIRDHAFRVFDGTDGSPNYLDPLFISLDLKNNFNYFVTNKIQKLFSKYLIEYLLDPSYNYQAKNIGLEPLKNLMGKIVIFASDGFQGSTLEEIVNYSWAYPDLKRFHYSEIDNQLATVNKAVSDQGVGLLSLQNQVQNTKDTIEYSQIKDFNKKGLTIVVPHKEGDILTYNYDPTNAWNLGCQFVTMNFQSIDTYMDKYINKFRKQAFVLKPKTLRN